MHAAQFAALFVTPPRSQDEESLPQLPVLQVMVVASEDVTNILWRPFPAVQQPQPPPPQLYANQVDAIASPERQTCGLAGSVGHYRCSPNHPCCWPGVAEELPIQITPQCTLPVSEWNKHGAAAASASDKDDGWFDDGNRQGRLGCLPRIATASRCLS
jgi:hypothetical protein